MPTTTTNEVAICPCGAVFNPKRYTKNGKYEYTKTCTEQCPARQHKRTRGLKRKPEFVPVDQLHIAVTLANGLGHTRLHEPRPYEGEVPYVLECYVCDALITKRDGRLTGSALTFPCLGALK
jgi:hypothetical protein